MSLRKRASGRRSLQLLTQTGPDTLMGTLLRTFWQPVAVAETLAKGTARGITILGEELTLYRGETGAPHLIGGRCAHRCTVLHTGWVQGDQIRCMYHGWRYDGTGGCTEMPAEKRALAGVAVAGYPVHEYAGLIFAYMGDGPTPAFDLPRKDVLETKQLFVRESVWDCNWFQQIENSLDAVHVSFVHMWGKVDRFGSEVSATMPQLTYEETSAGIRQTATRARNNVRISDWTFPNNNHVLGAGLTPTDPWWHSVSWVVPIDDERTLRLNVSAVDPESESAKVFAADPHPDFNPATFRDELFDDHVIPEIGGANGRAAVQDYVAVRGQGVVFDRSRERLASSDAGIALLRRIAFRELAAISEGRPTRRWTRLDQAAHLVQPGQELTGVR